MSFQQGLSGLNASAKALDVIGHNIANVSTVGFKGSVAQFADVFAASLQGAGATQIGVGANLANVSQLFTQGNITVTNNPLDVAINGQGFFRLSKDGAVSYTRNGQFLIDKEGYVVNSSGLRLQGYAADYSVDPAGIIVPSSPTDIFIDPSDIQPKETTTVDVGVNLDSRQGAPANAPFNPADPLSYNSSTAITIYDSLGVPQVLTMYFIHTGTPNQWQIEYRVTGPQIATPITPTGSPQTLTFSASGLPTGTTTVTLSNIDTNTGANVINNLVVDLGDSTQFGSSFGVNSLTQNGFSSGRLAGISISDDGVIQGRYSNGQTRKMGQIVLAKFNNPNGLMNLGDNQWQETSASGQPLIGAPGTGSLGVVQSAAIEESNVDLTAELVAMITQQRAYQANAQTIKTQDTIMQTLVNIR